MQRETRGANKRAERPGELSLCSPWRCPSPAPFSQLPNRCVPCQLFSPSSFGAVGVTVTCRGRVTGQCRVSPCPQRPPAQHQPGWVIEGTPRDVTSTAGSPSVQHLLNNPFESAPLIISLLFFHPADSSRLLGRRRPGYGTLQPDTEKSRMVGPRASPRGGRHKNCVLSAKTVVFQPQNDLVAVC